MRNYVSLLQELIDSPHNILIGRTLRFDLSQNDFPILTLRPIVFDVVIEPSYIPRNGIWINRKDKKLHFVYFLHKMEAYDDLPVEIASCALEVFRTAKEAKIPPGELILMFGKLYLEDKNVELAKQMLRRWPKMSPKISFNDINNTDDGSYELIGYNPHNE